ncbi:hypothetical protein [Georgenia sp. AZ-5]|uniref:hypothetical protein n=1 Tax=Georgenia sp. AZ-5 TaxID=3367526 RepID=UPI0037540639
MRLSIVSYEQPVGPTDDEGEFSQLETDGDTELWWRDFAYDGGSARNHGAGLSPRDGGCRGRPSSHDGRMGKLHTADERSLLRGQRVARAHGLFNVLGGLWPIISMRSFETVYGPPKLDRYLEYTIGGLLIANGLTQLRTAPHPQSVAQSRRIGVGTAVALTAVDVVFAPRRISPMYFVDAVMEVGWMLAWARTGRMRPQRSI